MAASESASEGGNIIHHSNSDQYDINWKDLHFLRFERLTFGNVLRYFAGFPSYYYSLTAQ